MQRKLSAAHIRTLCGSGLLVQRRENLLAMLDTIGVTEADVRDAITPIENALVRIDRDAKAWTLAVCGSAAIERYIQPRKPSRAVHGWTVLHEQARVRPWCPLAAATAAYGMLPPDAPQTRVQQLADGLTAGRIDFSDPERFSASVSIWRNAINHRTGLPTFVPRVPAGPIDLVYLYVDGSDPAWRERYIRHVHAEPPDGRCTDAGELRAGLRAADRFAPWIRTIYVVTDRQHPAWLDDHDRVRVVDHTEIMPAAMLPTFNSHAIEPHLHKIPGLSEHFIYANDDMLFAASVTPGQFFDTNGRALIGMGGQARSDGRGAWQRACGHAANLLDKTFGARDWRSGWHHMKPYRRSMLAEIAERLPKYVARTDGHKARSGSDIAWDAAFWPSYALATGYGVEAPHGSIRARYVGIDTDGEQAAADAVLQQRPHLICVNNGGTGSGQRIQALLESIYQYVEER